MSQENSHRHHYVPKWYQKRFMKEGQTAYYYLDLFPKIIKTPEGKIIRKGEILNKGVDKLFFEKDLNTTNFFGIENDDIEKYLFGMIDTNGALAIDSVASISSPDWMKGVHDNITNFFEYMDAQKLRTPKGLAWIKKVLNAVDHNDVLIKMQTIRQMHCTMWAESFMEIVSAEKSSVKFIVSDNPITVYNSCCYPKSNYCNFPFEPGIELKGTRTIFPLDLNHCVILTNIEYIRRPFEAKKPRTNPRTFDTTLINLMDIVKDRYLNDKEVLGINYILKNRAHKYIAASEKEWLYPERYLKRKDWSKFDKIFHPITIPLSIKGRGGQIYVGGKDNKLIHAQDEFGRKPKSKKEWDEKELESQKMYEHLMNLINKERENTNGSEFPIIKASSNL